MAQQAVAAAPDIRLEPVDMALPKHIPALDGLRGIAILLVVLHHLAKSIQLEFTPAHPVMTWVLNAFVLGWSGVDLFFVLSGFLITGILVDAKGSPRFLQNFYIRRALRIFPLYFTVLIAAVLAAAFVPAIRHWLGTEELWWQFLYATNINVALNGWQAAGWFGHFWSLAIEEHYYLLWPLLVLLFPVRTLIRITIGVWLAVFLLRWVVLHLYHPTLATYVLTPLRVDSLALGGCLAMLVRHPPARAWLARVASHAVWIAGVLIGALVLCAGSVSHEHYLLQGLGFSLFGICYAALLLQGVLPGSARWLSPILTTPIFRSAGKYSYGLYVFHVPVFMLVFHSEIGEKVRRKLLPADLTEGWAEAAISSIAALAISAGATVLSWNLLEKPALRLKQRFE